MSNTVPNAKFVRVATLAAAAVASVTSMVAVFMNLPKRQIRTDAPLYRSPKVSYMAQA